MPRHIVRQGECAASIGARFGLSADALLSRSGNEALKKARENPHVLLPGDVVDVPEPAARKISFTHGGTARYKARLPKTHLRMKIVDPAGQAAANRRFEVLVPGANAPVTGSTDGDGILDVEMAVTHTRATVRLFLGGDDPLEIPVRVGHLDPASTDGGVRGRLRNLGYPVGVGAEALANAVRAFQKAQELPETGIADDATRARLVERHGT